MPPIDKAMSKPLIESAKLKRPCVSIMVFALIIHGVVALVSTFTFLILSEVKASTKKVNNDTKPEFPGGKLAFVEFLKTHIVYPDSAKAHSVVGQVIASFFINSDGSVTDITIVQGLGDGISEGVIESLKQMPRWKPATHNGKPIRAQYKVPINFNGK